jgi:LysM repeat protein
MKKIILVLISALLVFSVVSCKTTLTQDDVNTALEKVYDKYRSDLITTGAKDYTVASGDTLTAIARKSYPGENAFIFPVIMLASDTEVSDPDLIQPGMKLSIPDLKANMDNPVSKAAIKSYLLDIAAVYKDKAVLNPNGGHAETEQGLRDLSASL